MDLNKLYSVTGDAESLTYLFDYIEAAFSNRDLDSVNELLGEFDPTKCNVIVSTGLLCCTSRAKNLLPNWSICFARISNHLDKIGEDRVRLLRGLQ